MDMDHDAPAPGVASPSWAELPADVLSEISHHLHDAADFLSFHAACRPWRASPPPAFHPWLVAPCDLFSSGMNFRWPFSPRKGKGVYLPHLPALRCRRFDGADAASGRFLAAGVYDDDRTGSLVNPLTGDDTPLTPLPYQVARRPGQSRSVVCSDGAVLRETMMGSLFAVVLRPGETSWRNVDVAASTAGLGRIDVLRMDEHDRRAAVLCSAGVLAGVNNNRAVAKLPRKPPQGDRYVLEHRGELLRVDVVDTDPPAAAVSVSVHALEVSYDGRSTQWVERQRGRGAEHICLFLGWESSFAVDAEEFAGAEVAGGCAYFVTRRPMWTEGREVHGVCRYNFEDCTATVVDELPAMFDTKSMWYTPRPRISPVPST